MAPTDGHDLIVKMIEQLRADMTAERNESRQSRARTHERMDEVFERLGKIDTSMAIAGTTDAQMRDEMNTLKNTVNSIVPAAREWSMAKRIGLAGASAVGLGAAGLGAWIAWAGDQAAAALRALLRLP
jgi:hypothetical protein